MADKIHQVYAFICTEADGTEGIPAIQAGGMHLPLIAADSKMIDKWRPHAERIARNFGLPVVLARFEIRTDLETIEGSSEDAGDGDEN